jgi:hypothetical protein
MRARINATVGFTDDAWGTYRLHAEARAVHTDPKRLVPLDALRPDVRSTGDLTASIGAMLPTSCGRRIVNRDRR